MKILLLILSLSFVVNNCRAQSPYKFKSEIDSLVANKKDLTRFVYAPLYLSFIGEYQEALKINDHLRQAGDLPPVAAAQKASFEKYHPIKAVPYILEQARKTSIVIINEAHNHSDHRLFASRLLPYLKKLGYNFIGFEALNDDDQELVRRKYPLVKQGGYIVDPSFGNFIRNALALNYGVFKYEAADGANNKEREIQEADNIVRMIKSNPNAKFLIYCGYDHAIEDSLANWGLAMAGRVKRLTGIDPLTIDQVQLTETSNREFDYPYRRLIDLNYDAVFVNEGKVFNKANESKTFDINLYHPQTHYIHGRPHWLKDAGNRYVPIAAKIDIGFPCLVFAYKYGDDMNTAVPVDVIELDDKGDVKDMVLPKGAVLIKAINQKGRQQIIHINDK